MSVKNLERNALLCDMRTGGARASVCAIRKQNGQNFFENDQNTVEMVKSKVSKIVENIPQNRPEIGKFW